VPGARIELAQPQGPMGFKTNNGLKAHRSYVFIIKGKALFFQGVTQNMIVGFVLIKLTFFQL
jgi:hypothetical protein